MANELCLKCGSEMVYFNRGGELVFDCHYDQKDCRIAELEQQLAEADLREENILAVLPEDFSAVEYIEELERQIEEAKAELERLKA